MTILYVSNYISLVRILHILWWIWLDSNKNVLRLSPQMTYTYWEPIFYENVFVIVYTIRLTDNQFQDWCFIHIYLSLKKAYLILYIFFKSEITPPNLIWAGIELRTFWYLGKHLSHHAYEHGKRIVACPKLLILKFRYCEIICLDASTVRFHAYSWKPLFMDWKAIFGWIYICVLRYFEARHA